MSQGRLSEITLKQSLHHLHFESQWSLRHLEVKYLVHWLLIRLQIFLRILNNNVCWLHVLTYPTPNKVTMQKLNLSLAYA